MLHFDLRLEVNGVLRSWAIPLEPNVTVGAPLEAIETEDHDVANLGFEGVHETGPIMFWDRGMWTPSPGFEDVDTWLDKGLLQFVLHGERLKGGWTLMRDDSTRNRKRRRWWLIKEDGCFARKAGEEFVPQALQISISTKRNMKGIVQDWHHRARNQGQMKLF